MRGCCWRSRVVATDEMDGASRIVSNTTMKQQVKSGKNKCELAELWQSVSKSEVLP